MLSLLVYVAYGLLLLALAAGGRSANHDAAGKGHHHHGGMTRLEQWTVIPGSVALGAFLGWVDLPHFRFFARYLVCDFLFFILLIGGLVWGTLLMPSPHKGWRIWGYIQVIIVCMLAALLLIHYSWLHTAQSA